MTLLQLKKTTSTGPVNRRDLGWGSSSNILNLSTLFTQSAPQMNLLERGLSFNSSISTLRNFKGTFITSTEKKNHSLPEICPIICKPPHEQVGMRSPHKMPPLTNSTSAPLTTSLGFGHTAFPNIHISLRS